MTQTATTTTAPGRLRRVRILSLDGAGIYGLAEALLLRGLCQRDPDFLKPGTVDLFTGTSAGAINCLLLATHENPREAVETGFLEDFWHEADEFTQSSPAAWYLSWLGYTPWFEAPATFRAQDKYFGKLRMRDLEQNVLISIMDWHGKHDFPGMTQAPDLEASPLDYFRSSIEEAWSEMLEAMLEAGRPGPEQTGYTGDPHSVATRPRRWSPHFFARLPTVEATAQTLAHEGVERGLDSTLPPMEHPALDYLVTNLAYAAQTPPVARPYKFGLGDGASGNVSPASGAFAWAYDHVRGAHGIAAERRGEPAPTIPLDAISVLSVGDCSVIPYHWQKSSYFSGLNWYQSWPSNPWTGAWAAPATYSFQAGAEENNEIVGRLLHDNFHRLNPGILKTAMVTATYNSRNPMWRRYILAEIEKVSHHGTACKAMDATAEWLKSPAWTRQTLS